jgi:hypothetical protein
VNYQLKPSILTDSFVHLQKYQDRSIKRIDLKMSDKEIKELTDLAKDRLKRKVSKEEALQTFMMAGILDKNGQFTEHYPHLAAAVAAKK